MAAEKFDIFEQYDNLIASGIPAEQARAQLNVLKDTLSTIVQNMATKEDIKILAVSMKEDINRIEVKVDTLEKSLNDKLDLKFNAFAKEYKLVGMNIKLNFVLWVLGACALCVIGACFKQYFPWG
jgi:hypothetical protein